MAGAALAAAGAPKLDGAAAPAAGVPKLNAARSRSSRGQTLSVPSPGAAAAAPGADDPKLKPANKREVIIGEVARRARASAGLPRVSSTRCEQSRQHTNTPSRHSHAPVSVPPNEKPAHRHRARRHTRSKDAPVAIVALPQPADRQKGSGKYTAYKPIATEGRAAEFPSARSPWRWRPRGSVAYARWERRTTRACPRSFPSAPACRPRVLRIWPVR